MNRMRIAYWMLLVSNSIIVLGPDIPYIPIDFETSTCNTVHYVDGFKLPKRTVSITLPSYCDK